MPNVAALHALVHGVLALTPASGILTPEQRAAYTALAAILPDLPVAADGTYAAAAVLSAGTHNSEGPWLYATHPFRLNTVGAAVAKGVNISTGVATWKAQGWMKENAGWSYGVMNAALLGLAEEAYAMVVDRASQPPCPGYRFPAFAAHYQDYDVSADHFSVMATATNSMLLQSGEDGAAGTIVLLPGWPCKLDVSFKLWGSFNTSVELVWKGGAVESLVVDPPTRAGAVKWGACVPNV